MTGMGRYPQPNINQQMIVTHKVYSSSRHACSTIPNDTGLSSGPVGSLNLFPFCSVMKMLVQTQPGEKLV